MVDGKGINDTCVLDGSNKRADNPNESIFVGTIKITETNDHFFCEFPIGASKGR